MNIRIVSYTARGEETAKRVAAALENGSQTCRRFAPEKFCQNGDEPLTGSVTDWAGEGFRTCDALIFCCAAGIAVRAIAPWVKSKTTDPAVLVLDEKATFVIPLLSGHIGGANALALTLSDALGATPVVTTATDLSGLFAVDVFAKENRLTITDMALAKEVSAALLAGEPVGFSSDLPVVGTLPKGLTEGEAALGVCVSFERKAPYERTLLLIPQRFALGVGCKKGKDAKALDAFLKKNLAACGVPIEALLCMASIDLKKDEPGLLAFSEENGLPFYTYTAHALNELPGAFSSSAFVQKTTGVDCVSERAAVKACGGKLIVKRIAEDGMTFALAETEEGIAFE